MHISIVNRSPQQRLIFYTLCLVYTTTGILAILPGPTLPLLAQHTGVTLDIAGWALTSSSLGFTIGVLLAGWLGTRLNAKYILLTGLICMAIAAPLTPLTHTYWVLLTAQFIAGFGYGFIDIGLNLAMTVTFTKTLGEMLNKVHSAYGIGALLGPLLLSVSLALLHEPLWAYLIGTFFALLPFILLTQVHLPVAATQPTPQDQSTRTAHSVFTSWILWLMALQLFLYVGVEVGFSGWVATAISQDALVTLALAAPAATLFWLGLTSGRLLGATLLKRGLLTENALLYLCMFGGGLSGLLAAFTVGTVWLCFTATLFMGLFLGPIFPGVMAIASRRFTANLGSVSSLLFFASGSSGFFFPVMIGTLITHTGASWGMALPAATTFLIIIPFYLANKQRKSSLIDTNSYE